MSSNDSHPVHIYLVGVYGQPVKKRKIGHLFLVTGVVNTICSASYVRCPTSRRLYIFGPCISHRLSVLQPLIFSYFKSFSYIRSPLFLCHVCLYVCCSDCVTTSVSDYNICGDVCCVVALELLLLYALFNHLRLLIQVARVQKAQFSYRLDGLVP